MAMQPTLDVIADVPMMASELQRFCNDGRKLFHTASDLLTVDAAELRWLLGKRAAGFNPWAMGVDQKIAARRVARHLVKAASASDLAAKEMVKTWLMFQQLFVNRPNTVRGQRVFQVNR